MTKLPILLIGAGGHARACIDVIEYESRFSVAGLVGLPDEVGTQLLGYPVLGTDTDLPALLRKCSHAFVAVGQIKTPERRIRIFTVLEQHRCSFPVIVSPYAYVSPHASLGHGTIVMHGAVVNAGAVVGCNCIINTRALVEHSATVGDHCHISTGAILNGDVKIGEGSFVGSGSVIKERVSLGKCCVVGMGISVRHDLKDHASLPTHNFVERKK